MQESEDRVGALRHTTLYMLFKELDLSTGTGHFKHWNTMCDGEKRKQGILLRIANILECYEQQQKCRCNELSLCTSFIEN